MDFLLFFLMLYCFFEGLMVSGCCKNSHLGFVHYKNVPFLLVLTLVLFMGVEHCKNLEESKIIEFLPSVFSKLTENCSPMRVLGLIH